LNFNVTIYEPGTKGGRVLSLQGASAFVPNRILEAGAELIGLNHPVWLLLAKKFGLALSVVTPEDDFAGAGLDMPLYLDGADRDSTQQERIYSEMKAVFHEFAKASEQVRFWDPWNSPNAAGLDAQDLHTYIQRATKDRLIQMALEVEFEFNNAQPPSSQSWLANLAQFAAGGGDDFFEDTEVFRCAAGNQTLAKNLADSLPVVSGQVTNININAKGVTIEYQTNGSPSTDPKRYDYVIVATSVAAAANITINGQKGWLPQVNAGPAVKYLAHVDTRFWIQKGLAPSGMSDELGLTWEGTDNQMDTADFDLSVFAGGRLAAKASKKGFQRPLSNLYGKVPMIDDLFQNWPALPNIGTGYSCPGPGQVTGAQQQYTTLGSRYDDRLFVAGEHTSPAWFGYMEGALQSGLIAAVRLPR
jgi:monoamine oxidase